MKLARLLLTVFGLGHLKPAPGTWGSAPPPAIVLLLGLDGRISAIDDWIINSSLVLLLLVFSYACLAWGDWAEAIWGGKDPHQVVADEVAGQSIALLALPWKAMSDTEAVLVNLALAGSACVAFRFFDIVKPPPASGAQRFPSGLGILTDDILAGLYALIATQLLAAWLWPKVFA